jgi:ABC-type phosphate transport system auxiliary subunit
MNKSKTKRSTRSSNTTTALYAELQVQRKQLIQAEKEMKSINKTLDTARADQKKYSAQDDGGENFAKTITLKNKILKQKDALEDKIEMIKNDMKSVFIFIRKKGGRKKRKSRKKIV